MVKKLKPYTIIPQELYVDRDADRQLEESLADMGRPPYVLVARQMGKTNLLLNAKRRLPNINDLFVYIDMSNAFSTARECFRNIIDRIIESDVDRLGSIEETVVHNRTILRSPHVEHGRELKLCLEHILGKLVIILDEIDALTRTTYSDEMISQIRSVYFERVNFVEYERLTYVLSGVAEPNEIIKNAKISPFNIGQKIYLGDFSFSEFLTFLKKSDLNISSEIALHIFEWTSGSPRLSWEICAEVEDLISKKLTVGFADVDQIVEDLYLTSFDRAPIDHIRDLVANDVAIRNAVIEIKYNKGDTLSDQVRRKLYLSGIISSSSLNGKAVIKNKIIEASLSDKWLDEIYDQNKDYYSLGNVAFEKFNYHEAYLNYRDFFEKKPEHIPAFFYWRYAISCYRLNKYEDAIENFNRDEQNRNEFEDLYLQKKNMLGQCYFYIRNYPEALRQFKEVIDADKKNYIYFDVKSSVVASEVILKSKSYSEILEYATETLQELDFSKDNLSTLQFDEVQMEINLLLGDLNKEYGYLKKSEDNYRIALSKANKFDQANALFKLMSLGINEEIKKYVDLIIEEQQKPYTFDPRYPHRLTSETLYRSAILLFRNDKIQFERLAAYIVNDIYANGTTINGFKTDLIDFITKFAISEKEVAISLLESIYKDPIELQDSFDAFNIVKQICLLNNNVTQYDSEYYKLLQTKDKTYDADIVDFRILIKNIILLLDNKAYRRALDWTDFAISLTNNLSIEFLTLFLYYRMVVYSELDNQTEYLKNANEIINVTNLPQFKVSMLENTTHDFIKQEAIKAISFRTPLPLISSPKLGRNEFVTVVYNGGLTKSGKYKIFENDILAGRCRILKNN